MAKNTAPNFSGNVVGIGFSEIENVVDVNFTGPLMLLTFEDGGINAYPASRSVVIMDGESFAAYIPSTSHVADIELEGDSLSRVSASTPGTLLTGGKGWCFIGDTVNFELMSDNGMFDIEPAEDDDSSDEPAEAEEDESDYGEEAEEEAEEDIAETPAPRRGRPAAAATRKQAEPEKRGRGRPRLSDEEKAERAAQREAEAAAAAAAAKRKAAPAAPARKGGIARPVAKSGFRR